MPAFGGYRKLVWGCVVMMTLLPSALGAEQDDRFRIGFIPYAWLPSSSGSGVTTGPLTSSADVCVSELFDEADKLIGLFGRVEGWKRRLGFYVDGGWIGMKFDGQSVLSTTVDLDFDIALTDFGLMYNVLDRPAGDADGRLALDAYVGGRFAYVGATVTPQIFQERSAYESWVDPVVGGRVTWAINRRWSVIASGDVGGFGAASDFTWEAMGYLSYAFNPGARVETDLLLGYKAVGWDYSTGSGLSRFEWDVILHGPVVGLAFKF